MRPCLICTMLMVVSSHCCATMPASGWVATTTTERGIISNSGFITLAIRIWTSVENKSRQDFFKAWMPDKAACKQIYSHESLVTTQKKSHATESCKNNSETVNKHFTKLIFGNCQQNGNLNVLQLVVIQPRSSQKFMGRPSYFPLSPKRTRCWKDGIVRLSDLYHVVVARRHQ